MFLDNQELSRFLSWFKFRIPMDGYVGVEREHFLLSKDGRFMPSSRSFLSVINNPRWTYELSACQVESRTRPRRDLPAIQLELLENANSGAKAAESLGLHLVNQEVGNADMSLEVYPDPRYLKIVPALSREKLEAACRVTGTHLHLGVKNMAQALAVYNSLIGYVEEFCSIGDHSRGERLRLYKTMAINWQPPRYRDAKDLFETARVQGFAQNPRNCWHLMRISIHGTVELRMFGVTDYVDEIFYWISRVMAILHGNGV